MKINNLVELKRYLERGGRPKYLFFWGHQKPRRGVSNACFSQWFAAAFQVAGVTYNTAEHYMMAEKARLFGDERAEKAIVAARSPAEAKQLGRGVANFNEAQWRAQRFAIVLRANTAKFEQNPALGEYLVATGERILVEASPVDRIWGIGLAADDPAAADPFAWRGENLLGFALMAARSALAGKRG